MILKNIASIFKYYMDLNDSQIWLKNEKVMLPKDQSFCVTVGFFGMVKPLGTSRRGSIQESISTTMTATVQVDIFGRNFEVLERKDEIIMALSSTFANESMIKNGFNIGKCPTSMNDISGIDGAAIPYRFQATFQVQYTKTITKNIDYYDQFENEVITNE